MRKGEAAHFWTSQDEQDFSKWFADYLKWAGYGNPANNPRVWKGLIMMHFPFLLENGVRNEAHYQNPTKLFKKVDRWMQTSLRADELMLKPYTDTMSFFNIAFLRPGGLS